jgi:hypothetical protein
MAGDAEAGGEDQSKGDEGSETHQLRLDAAG